MMTILENQDFIEGMFKTRQEAEQYLSTHPQKETCVLKDMPFDAFPLFIIEICRGQFFYVSSEEKARQYIADNKLTDSVTVYTIRDFRISGTINTDEMGSWEHCHLGN
jgi:hypothetical protein